MTPLDRLNVLILAYHGCDRSVAERILSGKEEIKASENDYDWLGHGAYFWENDPERALQWARQLRQYPRSKIRIPAILGAIIDPGECLNLMRSQHLFLLKDSYKRLAEASASQGKPLPENKPLKTSGDLLLRRLDCSVIEHLCSRFEVEGVKIDSVRGVFFEGRELYPNAGFRQKNHVQMCVRNIHCIKGYFRPRGN